MENGYLYIVSFPIQNMVIFHSYVCLPEGKPHNNEYCGYNNNKPPIWELLLPTMYGDLGDDLLLLYPHYLYDRAKWCLTYNEMVSTSNTRRYGVGSETIVATSHSVCMMYCSKLRLDSLMARFCKHVYHYVYVFIIIHYDISYYIILLKNCIIYYIILHYIILHYIILH